MFLKITTKILQWYAACVYVSFHIYLKIRQILVKNR